MNKKTEQFKEKIKKIYPAHYQQVLEGISKLRLKTFRTTAKANKNTIEAIKKQGFDLKDGPFPKTYIVMNQRATVRLSQTHEVEAAQVRIQNPSSMITVMALKPKPGEKILDLCAAPGSKTMQIADRVGENSEIIAVEKNRKRFFKLKDLLEASETKNIVFHQVDGTRLLNKHPEYKDYFDKILVDAPCSSEGRMSLSDSKNLKYWNKNKYKQMVGLQKALIASAINMLKIGGTLVYSTCTFSVEENEMVVDWLLKKFSNLDVLEISEDLPIKNKMEGFIRWKNKELNGQLSKTIRILPNEAFEGFYIAKIKKSNLN